MRESKMPQNKTNQKNSLEINFFTANKVGEYLRAWGAKGSTCWGSVKVFFRHTNGSPIRNTKNILMKLKNNYIISFYYVPNSLKTFRKIRYRF